MKSIFIVLLFITVLQPGISSVNAQRVPDSTMQKINGFRVFYETLGKAFPPDSTITESAMDIAGVKTYWFNQKQVVQKNIVIYLHGGVYTYGNINAYRAMVSHLSGLGL